MAKKVPCSDDERGLSYFKYYAKDIAQAPAEKYAAIGKTPGDNAKALHIDNRNDLFKPGELPGEFGWWLMDDGTALIANQTYFPGVTGEMFDWWFAWHPSQRLRYAIWDNEDHYDVYLEDPAKARDLSKSQRERHWGSIHYVWEDVGFGGLDLLRISFKEPGSMGYDTSKIDTEHCNALVCANVHVFGSGDMHDVPVVMTHFLRPKDQGSELRSRFWFGWQIDTKTGKAQKMLPPGVSVPAAAPIALLNHNVKEFWNLTKLLPEVYAEEKDRWL
jgi:hypothetical protein